jgi:hypothetical protein
MVKMHERQNPTVENGVALEDNRRAAQILNGCPCRKFNRAGS